MLHRQLSLIPKLIQMCMGPMETTLPIKRQSTISQESELISNKNQEIRNVRQVFTLKLIGLVACNTMEESLRTLITRSKML